MLRPYPFLVPSYQQPGINGITTTLIPLSQNKVSPVFLKEVVDSIMRLGIETVYNLCQQRLEGHVDLQAIRHLTCEKNVNLDWLALLSSAAIHEVQNTVAALIGRSNHILAVFKKGANRNQEIVLFSSEPDSVDPYQIIARVGAIYFQTTRDLHEEIQLMSFAQYLSYGKPAWQEWDFCGLDVNGLNLSGVILRGNSPARFIGTDLSGSILDGVWIYELNKANLANATITNMPIYPKVDGDTIFENTTITFSSLSPDYDNHDNHDLIDRLNFINTIDNKFMDLKINLLHQTIDALKANTDRIPIRIKNMLLRHFFNNDTYMQNDKIRAFAIKKLLSCSLGSWLVTLNNHGIGELQSQEGIAEIKTVLDSVENNLKNILAAFQFGADRQKDILLLESHYPKSNRAYALIAKAGAIYLKSEGSNDLVQVVSFKQFLSQHWLVNDYGTWTLYDLDLSHLDLSEVDLSSANLWRCDLSYTNLTKANLDDSVLDSVILIGANLSYATMNNTVWVGFKVDSTTRFQYTSIKLNFDDDDLSLDQVLNHLTNEESGSYLSWIDEIADHYFTPKGKHLKLDLMHQLIAYVEGYLEGDSWLEPQIFEAAQAIMQIFTKNPLYLNDPIITAFIKKHILFKRITEGNTAELKCSGAPELRLLLNLVNSHEQPTQFMLDNNGFFIQLMMLCTEKGRDADIQQHAQQLYQTYLNLSH